MNLIYFYFKCRDSDMHGVCSLPYKHHFVQLHHIDFIISIFLHYFKDVKKQTELSFISLTYWNVAIKKQKFNDIRPTYVNAKVQSTKANQVYSKKRRPDKK